MVADDPSFVLGHGICIYPVHLYRSMSRLATDKVILHDQIPYPKCSSFLYFACILHTVRLLLTASIIFDWLYVSVRLSVDSC